MIRNYKKLQQASRAVPVASAPLRTMNNHAGDFRDVSELVFGTHALPEVSGMIINGPEGCGSDLGMPYNFLSFLIMRTTTEIVILYTSKKSKTI